MQHSRQLSLGVLIVGLMIPASLIFAQSVAVTDPTSIGGAVTELQKTAAASGIVSTGTFTDTLLAVIGWLLSVSAILALGALIWGGVTYIISLGDEKRVSRAKTIILYAVVGIFVVLLSFIIISTIKTALGLDTKTK